MPSSIQNENRFLLPPAYRNLSRRKRVLIELGVGMAILALIPIGVSVNLPIWLQLLGWAFLIANLAAQSILIVAWWRKRGGWER